MALYIFLAFLLVPFAEIAAFIKVGSLIGLGPTLLIVILTALTGIVLLRAQGLATLREARASLQRGEMPVEQVVHGLLLAAAGVLLLIPGFVTDTLGLLLFVPAIRLRLAKHLFKRLLAHDRTQQARGHSAERGPQAAPRVRTIEADYHDITPPGDRRGRNE